LPNALYVGGPGLWLVLVTFGTYDQVYFDVHAGQDKIQRIGKNEHTFRCYPLQIKRLLTNLLAVSFYLLEKANTMQDNAVPSILRNKMLTTSKHEC